MKLFSVDGKLYKFMSRLWDILQLNVCWLICSLPIVTMGAATVAAFCITNKMVKDEEGYIIKPFFAAFINNLKRGIPLGLLAMFAGYVVYLDFQIFNAVEGNPVIFAIMGFAAAFIFTFSFIYAFSISADYDNTVFETIRLSASISGKYLLRTLLLIIVLAFELFICLYNNITVFFGIIIGPACMFLTTSGFSVHFFNQISKDKA